MSFLSGLQSASNVVGKVTSTISPFLGLLGMIPALQGKTGTVIGTVLQVVFLAETVIASAGSGKLKKESVLAMLRPALPGFGEQRLSQIVDLSVSLLNLVSNGDITENNSATSSATVPA